MGYSDDALSIDHFVISSFIIIGLAPFYIQMIS